MKSVRVFARGVLGYATQVERTPQRTSKIWVPENADGKGISRLRQGATPFLAFGSIRRHG